MRKKEAEILITTCAALVMAAFISGCNKAAEPMQVPPPNVTVMTPAQRDVTVYIKYPGQLRAKEIVDIEARVSGFLMSVDFSDGDMVKKGQKLFTIEDVVYKAAVEQSKADLAKAEAQLKVASTSLDRMRNAYKTKAVSEIDVLVAEGDMDSAKANVMAAEAQLAASTLNLSYTVVVAPFDGRISRHFVSVGNLVGSGVNTKLAELVTIDPIHLYFNVDERTLLQFVKKAGGIRGVVPEGDYPVKMELADRSVYGLDGYVDYVGNIMDNKTGTLPARAIFENNKGELVSGMFGKVMIPQEYKQAILLPEKALLRDMVGPFFLVVNDKGVVENKYVTLGPLVNGECIVEKGITSSDRIIIKGILKSRPGVSVNAKTATEEEKQAAIGMVAATSDDNLDIDTDSTGTDNSTGK
jgi:RND family efflux transporter MFP subunit